MHRFCLRREYSFLRKKTKKIENWPCQRNIADQGTRMHRFCLRREYSFLRKKTKKLKIGHVNGILLTKEHASMRCGNKIGYLTRSKTLDFGKRRQKKKGHSRDRSTSARGKTAKNAKKKRLRGIWTSKSDSAVL